MAPHDLEAVERAIALIERLAPNYIHGAHVRFEAAMAPLLDRLDVLGERHLAGGRVPSPCGHSRFFVPGWAWVNLLCCLDACGRCRREALGALRLVREGIVGRPA